MGVGGGVDNKMGGGRQEPMIFMYLFLPEMVNALILLLERMCFL